MPRKRLTPAQLAMLILTLLLIGTGLAQLSAHAAPRGPTWVGWPRSGPLAIVRACAFTYATFSGWLGSWAGNAFLCWHSRSRLKQLPNQLYWWELLILLFPVYVLIWLGQLNLLSVDRCIAINFPPSDPYLWIIVLADFIFMFWRARTMKKTGLGRQPESDQSPSQMIDARIEELGDWRGAMLRRLRALIKEADPDVVEEWKWRGVPVWSHNGLICTGETYKNVVKMTFAKGAALNDPSGLFNSSLDGNTRRAIDFHEGDQINEEALKSLVRAAVLLNTSKARR
jgi:hypothetical protein